MTRCRRLAALALATLAAAPGAAAAVPARAAPGATQVTVDLSWPAVAPGVRTRTLRCPVAAAARTQAAELCGQLAEPRAGGLLPTPAAPTCALAPLERRSAHVRGVVGGVAVDAALAGCDEPAIGDWFLGLGGFRPDLTRPRLVWCPGGQIDPGQPPIADAPIVVTPTWPRGRVAASRVLAEVLAGMRGSPIRRAGLFSAGRLARYTSGDHVLLVDAPKPDVAHFPEPGGSVAADAFVLRSAEADWARYVLEGALRDRLCATANGPVVGTAAIRRGRLIRSRGELAGDVAYGQVFDAEPPAQVAARLRLQLAAAGLVPTTIRVFEPLGAAPLVIATAPDPRAFAAHLGRNLATIAGSHADFQLYEGMLLVVRDAGGSTLNLRFFANRTGVGGGAGRPDLPFWGFDGSIATPIFHVPVGTRRFEGLPSALDVPGTRHRIDRIRWLPPGPARRPAWRATARYRACPLCHAQAVTLRAVTRPAGCGARALVGVVLRDPAGRVRTFRGLGSAPDCLVTGADG